MQISSRRSLLTPTTTPSFDAVAHPSPLVHHAAHAVEYNQINPKVARFIVDAATNYGLDERDIARHLRIAPQDVDFLRRHMSWNIFATLLNLYTDATSPEFFVDTLWKEFERDPINHNLMKIFRNIASPAYIYRIMDRYIGPRMMPCLRGESELLDSNILVNRIIMREPEGAVPCPIYFHFVIESLRAAPSLLMGLQPAILLDFETDGLSGTYTLRLPPTRSILGRLRDATRIFVGARSLFDLLETHQQEQHQTYEQLKMLNQDLECRVAQRTRELANLNAQLEQATHQAERESAAKSRHMANLSHEIRTPLSAIIGYAELLEEEAIDQVDEQCAEDLRSITSSAKHLLALIGDILDLSKIEADKLSILNQDIPLQPLIQELYTTFKPMADQNQNLLKISIEIPHDLQINTDVMRLKQILMNLLSNAIKFTTHGKIFLQVEPQDDVILFHVKDTGRGMSKEELGRIFEPFEQARHDTQHNHGGTGLGMTISRQLAELMGGRLDANSSPGIGSTFTLTLPRKP